MFNWMVMSKLSHISVTLRTAQIEQAISCMCHTRLFYETLYCRTITKYPQYQKTRWLTQYKISIKFCSDLIYGLIYSVTLRWRHAKKTHFALLDLCVWNRWPASVIPKMLNEQVGNPWLDALTTLEYIFVIYMDNITRSGMYSFTIAYQWYTPWSNGYIANITQSLCMNSIKWYVVYFEINILQ